MKPKAYRLGKYQFERQKQGFYTNGELQVSFLEEELIGLGAVPVKERLTQEQKENILGMVQENIDCLEKHESKHIEKLDTYWGYDIEEMGDKINEIIDYLQKG